MKLKKEGLPFRLYFFAQGILDAYTGKDRCWKARTYGMSFCRCFWVVVAWAPLVLLMHAFLYAFILFSLIFFPGVLFGWENMWMVTLIFLKWGGYSVMIIGVTALMSWLFWELARFYWFKPKATIPQKAVTVVEWEEMLEEEKEPGIFDMWAEWLKAKHEKVCPHIEFEREV